MTTFETEQNTWKPTTEKPQKKRRRYMSIVVLNPGGIAKQVVYDANTGRIRNDETDAILVDYEWWIFAPLCKLNIR